MNPTPQIVAVFFVGRLIKAVLSRMRKTVKIPIGISISPLLGLDVNIQRHAILPRRAVLKRRNAMDMVMKTNDQMTPNAYASPSVSTSPKLATMTTIWRIAMRLMSRWVVPKRLCGCWNHGVRTPSSARRFSTPLEPTMLVFTAPARIRNPTITTKHSMMILSAGGPTRYCTRPLMRLSRYPPLSRWT